MLESMSAVHYNISGFRGLCVKPKNPKCKKVWKFWSSRERHVMKRLVLSCLRGICIQSMWLCLNYVKICMVELNKLQLKSICMENKHGILAIMIDAMIMIN